MKRSPLSALAISAAALLTAPSAIGGQPLTKVSEPQTKSQTFFDELWNLATLYKDDTNPFIQEFRLKARYHGQHYWVDSDQGSARDWENRRPWYGFDARLFNRQVQLFLRAATSEDFSEAYESLIDAYLRYSPSKEWSLTIGRQKPRIAHYDWVQSSQNAPTLERSQPFGQIAVNRVTGAVLEYKKGPWDFVAGAYSNDIDDEFGSFDGGHSISLGFGYRFESFAGLDHLSLHFDYLESSISENDTLLNRYERLFTATAIAEKDRFGIFIEGFAASGGAADFLGGFIQLTYELIPDRFELVTRYTLSGGDGPNSVVAQRRYEREAPQITGGGQGETYQALYLGTQTFIHGDKLKLLAGAEYADLDGGGDGGDYSGWTYLVGVRVDF
jgi:hypothetical protein